MKKLIVCLIALTTLFACRGPRGYQGDPGYNLLGQTFETTVDFGYESQPNLWSAFIEIPSDIEVYDSDAILIYRLEAVEASNGGLLDTYSLIPQDFFLSQGTIEYVYNHTATDVELLIDGDFNLNNLDPVFTDAQVFRVVILPSDWANDPNVNLDTYGDLLDSGIDFEEL